MNDVNKSTSTRQCIINLNFKISYIKFEANLNDFKISDRSLQDPSLHSIQERAPVPNDRHRQSQEVRAEGNVQNRAWPTTSSLSL